MLRQRIIEIQSSIKGFLIINSVGRPKGAFWFIKAELPKTRLHAPSLHWGIFNLNSVKYEIIYLCVCVCVLYVMAVYCVNLSFGRTSLNLSDYWIKEPKTDWFWRYSTRSKETPQLIWLFSPNLKLYNQFHAMLSLWVYMYQLVSN